jgi:hypothetical protein
MKPNGTLARLMNHQRTTVPQNKYHWIELPKGEVRIIAIRSGGYGNLHIPHVNGVLTLGENGTASFQRTPD